MIGDIKRLPEDVQKKLQETMEHTAQNTAMTMVVALSYSARWEIVEAMRVTVREAITLSEDGNCENVVQKLTEEAFCNHLETRFMPDPDLLIRTGGELRISNFLLWQIAGLTLKSRICNVLL